MAITINSSRDNADDKTVFFTIAYDGKDYKWHGDIPKDADAQESFDNISDTIKAEILRKQYRDAEVPQLDGKSALESFEAWVSAGAKNAEVSQEIPAVAKKDAVYEDVETEPAIEAKDAVMGERQKETSKEVEKSNLVIVKEGGKYVQKTVTATETVKEPVWEEVQLYDDKGAKITNLVSEAVEAKPSVKYEKGDDIPEGKKVGMVKTPAVTAKAAVYEDVKHKIPVMESYEVEPAVEAKAAVTEKRLVSEAVTAVAKQTLIIQPEATIEKKAWVDSH